MSEHQETIKPKILIVEDEAIIALDLQSHLEHLGYTVLAYVNSAEKALEVVEQESPDLVLMDIVLKGKMDGIEAAEIIRSQWGIPVVFVTAYADHERLERAKLVYPYGYTLKPFRDNDLKVTVEMALYIYRVDRERKRVEEALRETRQLLEKMFLSLNEAIFIVDASTTEILDCNPAVSKIFGYSREEMLRRKTDFLHVDEATLQEFRTHLSSAMQEKGCLFLPLFRMKRKDGTIFLTEHSVMSLEDEYGQRIGWMSVVRDITERIQAEELLRESEEQFRVAQELSPDGFTILRPIRDAQERVVDFTWVYENAAIARLNGTDPKTVVGRRLLELFPGHSGSQFLRAYQLVAESGEYCVFEADYSGESMSKPTWFRVAVVPMGGDIAILAQDITDRKRGEEERERLQTQLNQSQKMESVGRLAGGVAHDFNNMLGVILGYTELAQENVSPGQPLHANLEEIKKAARRSADLTRQLLAFARKQTVAPRVLDLNETVEGMLQMLRRLIGENLHLAWHPGAGVWPVKVDPGQIDQILANLCVNAHDAVTDVGQVTIETGNSALDEAYCAAHEGFLPGEYVRLAVSDDGCGMAQDTLAYIFEPFFTTKGVGQGTGMGLATVYGIVKQNNGFIHVSSELGKGTTFTIYLPRHMGQVEPARTEGASGPDRRGRETILLVEDEPAILKMTTMILERQGYTVLNACTPGEAMRLAEEHPGKIHLLMTDVVMPEMNGLDLAKRLLFLYPNLKRLFMSGYTANVIARQGVLDEGVHFIQKPFSIKELADKVRETLDRK